MIMIDKLMNLYEIVDKYNYLETLVLHDIR